MKIGELSERTGVQIQTIRFYESEGLLPSPSRSGGNYRLYEPLHVQRLAFIRHCRSLDMTLDEIKVLLRLTDAPNENCGEVNRILDRHIEQVARRIKELRCLERDLKDLRGQCRRDTDAKDCKILGELTKTSALSKQNAHPNNSAGSTENRARPKLRSTASL